MSLKYRGDQTGDFDPKSETGLVGKVVGPTANGRWLVVTGAEYDADKDVTHAETALLQDPNSLFERMVAGDES